MSGKSNNSLQILVDCFDDIPNIMTKMNESINNSPTRYKGSFLLLCCIINLLVVFINL